MVVVNLHHLSFQGRDGCWSPDGAGGVLTAVWQTVLKCRGNPAKVDAAGAGVWAGYGNWGGGCMLVVNES